MADARWDQLKTQMRSLLQRITKTKNNDLPAYKETLSFSAKEIAKFPRSELFPGKPYYQAVRDIFLTCITENGKLKVLLKENPNNRQLIFSAANLVKVIVDLCSAHEKLSVSTAQKEMLSEILRGIDSVLEGPLMSMFLAAARPSRTNATKEV